MNNIKKLPQNLINKIAAGEVVERPASALKELLENSLDAKARNIVVKVKSSGIKEVTVIDDGVGIMKDDIELAFTDHATSKISELDDLMNINSFGFRGEALSSIAAVADVEVHTYNADSDPTFVKFVNGNILTTETKPRGEGTTISIIDLFKDVPARKNFLSAESTEYRHLLEVFNAVCLANPTVSFKLFKDDRGVADYKPGSLLKRVGDVFGEELSNGMIEVNFDAPEIKISGLIGHPDIASDKKPVQYLFLNSRPIIEKTVMAAIREGFKNSIPRDRKPSYILFVELPADTVDVNVHPRKTEVRIRKGVNIYMPVKNTIERTIDIRLQEELKNRFSSNAEVRTASKVENQSYEAVQVSNYSTNTVKSESFGSYSPSKKALINQSFEFTETILKNDFTPEYIYLEQLFRTYLLFQKDETLIIIDQHAADERINHEKIEARLLEKSRVESQQLLAPYVFDTEYVEELKNALEELLEMGVEISYLGGNSFQLTSIPEFMAGSNFSSLIDAIQEDLSTLGSNLKFDAIQNKLIATIACHSSIRAGDILNSSQADKIIRDLLKCKKPYSCPHGRPIMWELSKQQIAKNFERNK